MRAGAALGRLASTFVCASGVAMAQAPAPASTVDHEVDPACA